MITFCQIYILYKSATDNKKILVDKAIDRVIPKGVYTLRKDETVNHLIYDLKVIEVFTNTKK
jgi:hypothetical protein